MADVQEAGWYALRGHQFANTAFIGFAILIASEGTWLTVAGVAAVGLGLAGAFKHERERAEVES